MSVAYEPLYGDGTGLKGFVCCIEIDKMGFGEPCGKLCKNQVGMLLHLERRHGVRLQQCLFEEPLGLEEKLIGRRGNSA